jgi:replicative DNA helicase
MQQKKTAQSFMQEKWQANAEAEENILAIILCNPYTLNKVIDILQPDHFSRDAFAVIYGAMVKLSQQGRLSTLDNLVDELDRRDKLEEVGGKIYLQDLETSDYAFKDVIEQAEIVIRKATMRKLRYAAQEIATMAMHEDDDAVERAEQIIYEIAVGAQTKQPMTFAESLDEYISVLEQRREDAKNNCARGLPTGYKDIDRMIGGLQPGALYTIGALTGFGKSAFALNVAMNIVTAPKGTSKHIYFASLEMRHLEITQRALSMSALVDQSLMRDGMVSDDEMQKIKDHANALKQCQIHIDDKAFNINEILSNAKRLHARHRLDLVVVDYIQLIESVERNKNSTRAQDLADLSRKLKQLAQQLDVPVIALVQLNRTLESQQEQEPKLAHINESGGIARDSDAVLFIYSTKEEIEKREANKSYHVWIKVAKARSGRLGSVPLRFSPRVTLFKDAEESFSGGQDHE